VTRNDEVGTTLLVTAKFPSSPLLSTLMMEALRSSRNVGSYKSHKA
jgi:hypothetical protein